MSNCLCPLKQAAKDDPTAIGYQCEGATLTFAELDAKTDLISRELDKKGLQAQDRIAALIPASLHFYTLLFATLRIGAIFCPLNLRLPSSSLESHLLRLSPKFLITSSGVQTRPSLSWNIPPSSILLFTSGSTGTPKLAVLSLNQLLANGTSATNALDLRLGDGWLLSLPLHHVGGLSILFRCLLARAILIQDPTNFSTTHLSYVPAQLYQSWPLYPKLRCLLLGGSPIREIPSKLPICISYGMTETASMILKQSQPIFSNDLLYLGFPLPGKEVRLNQEREILVRADSLFSGYWNGETLETPFDAEGWFSTKDLGQFDPIKGFAIVGRKDNQFISGGENIQPEEIEQELVRYPGVMDAIVVPINDARFGNRPVACLRIWRGVIEKKSMIDFLVERLPSYKIPIAFFSLDELGYSDLKMNRKQIFELIRAKMVK